MSPLVIIDGTSNYNAATFNKFLASDGTKTGVKNYHFFVYYDGADFVVDAVTDSSGVVDADLTFTGGYLEIVLSGFTEPPQILVSPDATDSSYFTKAKPVSNVLARIGFYSARTTRVTTADTDMRCSVIIQGE